MIQRKVTSTRKDDDGDITALCNPSEWWSPRSKADAISDIENEDYGYYVEVGGERVSIHVVQGASGKYLRTDPDKTTGNNLDDLPDC